MYGLCLKKKPLYRISVNDYVADLSRVYGDWVQDKQYWKWDGWMDNVSYFHSKDCVVDPNLCLYMEIEETEKFSQLI